MKFRLYQKVLVFLSSLLFLISCGSSETVDPVLKISTQDITFEAEGGEITLTVECNDAWSANNPASWLELSQVSGSSGNTTVVLTTGTNSTGTSRSVILTFNSSNGQSRRVTISQASLLFPSYNTSPQAPDATGMNSTAVQLAAKMGLGWNIGNTMEAIGGETAWGNPLITEDYVKFVKQQGFNAIRLPCAWDWGHVDDEKTARINTAWLNRVKEVVGYCVNNDMYVLLNIHYDGGWLEHNITKAKQDSVSAKQKAFWEQIATTMRDFDEHLMFASANEPSAHSAEEVGILLSYHQTFINAVRSTGGKNSYRVLVLQGPNTNMSFTPDVMSTLPTDQVPNRLMVEVHNYNPSQFCFGKKDEDWGKMLYYWGSGHHSTIEPDRNATYGEEEAHIADFKKMKETFVDKGIPVLIGEYGAYRRNNTANVPLDLETHEASVDYWITFVTKQALTNGMIPFWWDTGGALDRTNLTVKDQRTIDALIAGTK